MFDSFWITILFIVIVAAVVVLMRRKSSDKCLKDFSGDMVTLENTSGSMCVGTLQTEHTGLELIYPYKQKSKDGYDETSYILYKYEYPTIQALVRYHDLLDEKGRKKREKELKKTYHPRFLRRFKRQLVNMFKTAKDSVMEILNLIIAQAKRTTGVGTVLSSQDKYVTQVKQELAGGIGTAFEPLLEKYIGHKVILELIKGDTVVTFLGVLKEYTAEFIEVMDVGYKGKEDKEARTTDLIVLRKYGTVRHFAE